MLLETPRALCWAGLKESGSQESVVFLSHKAVAEVTIADSNSPALDRQRNQAGGKGLA